MSSFVVGLISDTHGLLRFEALAALRGCHAILHAGDVGDLAILDELKTIAPVHAVRGNTDTEPSLRSLPQSAVFQSGAVRIYVLHNLKELDFDPRTAGFHVVASGHTHQPGFDWRDGVLYINPGSAGPRRFRLPVCLARLDLLETPWHPELVQL